jgi:hypothetical protein
MLVEWSAIYVMDTILPLLGAVISSTKFAYANGPVSDFGLCNTVASPRTGHGLLSVNVLQANTLLPGSTLTLV